MPHTLILGGSRGIGLALSGAFVAAGHTVSVMARRPPQGETAATMHFYQADFACPAGLPASLEAVVRDHGPLDNLICCQRQRGATESAWEIEFTVSVSSVWLAIETLKTHFSAAGGSIVIIGSLAGRMVADEQPLEYHVAKAALEQLVRYYAVLLGAQGLRVNALIPGTVDKRGDGHGGDSDSYRLLAENTPLGRMCTSGDIAGVSLFLSSSEAAFLTGQSLILDGGLSLRLQASMLQGNIQSGGK